MGSPCFGIQGLDFNNLLYPSKVLSVFLNVREAKGLCYYIRTTTDDYTDTGAISTSAGIDVSRIDMAIEAILEQYKLIMEEPVGEAELTKAKELVMDIHKHRERKILKAASDNVALERIPGYRARKQETKNLLPEERELFRKVAKILTHFQQRLADFDDPAVGSNISGSPGPTRDIVSTPGTDRKDRALCTWAATRNTNHPARHQHYLYSPVYIDQRPSETQQRCLLFHSFCMHNRRV